MICVTVEDETFLRAVRMQPAELTSQLVGCMGPTLVAALANVRDRKLPHKWATHDRPRPRPDALSRLQVAYRAWAMIESVEGDDIARAWFIGANPRLGEVPPYLAIRQGRFGDVIAAATALAESSTVD